MRRDGFHRTLSSTMVHIVRILSSLAVCIYIIMGAGHAYLTSSHPSIHPSFVLTLTGYAEVGVRIRIWPGFRLWRPTRLHPSTYLGEREDGRRTWLKKEQDKKVKNHNVGNLVVRSITKISTPYVDVYRHQRSDNTNATQAQMLLHHMRLLYDNYDSYDVHYDDLHYLSKYRGGHFCFFACSRRKKSSSSSTVLYIIRNILEEQVRSVDSDLWREWVIESFIKL